MRDINRELIDSCISEKRSIIRRRNKDTKGQLIELNKNILAMENEIKRLIKINIQLDIAIRKKRV